MKSSKIFTVHRILRDTNFKHEKATVCTGSFLDFSKFVFYSCKKTGHIDFPEKLALTKVKYLLPVCQISQIFTEGKARKFSQFCFLCSCLRHKILKNTDIFLGAHADYLSFHPQHACDRKTIGSHLNTSTVIHWVLPSNPSSAATSPFM